MFFSRFGYYIFYVLYQFVTYLLTLPPKLKIDMSFVIHPHFFNGMCVELEHRLGGGGIKVLALGRLTGYCLVIRQDSCRNFRN
jgi:hypothetical protein